MNTYYGRLEGDVLIRPGVRRNFSPVQNLMLAVLEDAVYVLQKYATSKYDKEKRLYREAEEWALSKDSSWIFSFNNVCENLGLDPSYIRKGIMDLNKKNLEGSPNNQRPERKKLIRHVA